MSASKPDDHGGQPDDDRLLAMLRSMFEAADPVPPGLADRVRFAVALAGLPGSPDLDGELARLTEQEAALARGAPEESRTITFDSSSLTIMIRIDANADGTVRVDGWLAPPGPCRVEITLSDGPLSTEADAEGRFAFGRVPRGAVRIVVRQPGQRAGTGEAAPPEMKTVVTPALVL